MDHEALVRFVLEVAVVVLAAKVFGEIFSRKLKQPAVLGELVAGMIIGPYALGRLNLLGMGPLFPLPAEGALPVSPELHALAQIASIVLLFLAGLETDLNKFLRYSVAGLVVGIGGAVFSFVLGDMVIVWMGFADDFMAPQALFMGAVATATSVGITARVLTEKRKLETAEGSTILSAAVIDDIIGLIILAVVISLSRRGQGGALEIDWGHIGLIGAKAMAFWVGTMAAGILLSRYIGRLLSLFGGAIPAATAALGLALLLAAFAEKANLALIVGAYTMGISLSQIDRASELQERLQPVYDFLVPLFFCVTGMMADFSNVGGTLLLGAVFTGVCILSKVVGCGLFAYPLGFNTLGATRIGVGMMPRGEVALIVAAMALATIKMDPQVFAAAIVMTFVTTLAAPSPLALIFTNASGLRRTEKEPPRATAQFQIRPGGPDLAALVADRMAEAFRQEQFFVHHRAELGVYEMRKESQTVIMRAEDDALVFSTDPGTLEYARLIVLEEVIALREIFHAAADFGAEGQLKQLLLGED